MKVTVRLEFAGRIVELSSTQNDVPIEIEDQKTCFRGLIGQTAWDVEEKYFGVSPTTKANEDVTKGWENRVK